MRENDSMEINQVDFPMSDNGRGQFYPATIEHF